MNKTRLALSALAFASACALSSAAQAPAGAPAGSTGVCNDGTYSTAASKSGACGGHKGVKTWYGPAKAATPAPAATPAKPAMAVPAAKPAPAPAASGAVTGVCNDGTNSTAASKSGACRGHGGVKSWGPPAAAPAMAQPAMAQPAMARPAAAPAPAANIGSQSSGSGAGKTTAAATAPAAGGGPGMVWVNTASKVYHCPTDRYYGKTKAGKYLSESAAQAEGDKPDAGKKCF